MKDQTQINRKNKSCETKTQSRRRGRKIRIRFGANRELIALFGRAAKKLGVTRSAFIRRSIQEKLTLIEEAIR